MIIMTELFVMDYPCAARRRLAERFDQSPLAYHNRDHILSMLRHLEVTFARPALIPERDIRLIRAAIWFHDLVYDPRAKDNEQRSAEEVCLLDLPYSEQKIVEDMILATASHRSSDPMVRILLDLDLSILAARPEVYREYARGIRAEYSFVEPNIYIEHRIEVLKRLCDTPMLEILSMAQHGKPDVLREFAVGNMQWEQNTLHLNGLAPFE